MLLLFDIDATLLKTSGEGLRAMVDAGQELFGPGFTGAGVESAGRLDPLIIRDMLTASGIAVTPTHVAAIRAGYHRHLKRRLAPRGVAFALPGVHELIDALLRAGDATLGLLTGNFEETGCFKLATCGIDPDRFAVRVWGDESPHEPPSREHLPPIGLERYRVMYRRELPPSSATIIGDTPHDMRCAKLHGLRALGVATGPFSPEHLIEAGADRAVRDLTSTGDVLEWLVSS